MATPAQIIRFCGCYAAMDDVYQGRLFQPAYLNAGAGCTLAGAGPGEVLDVCAQRGVPAVVDDASCERACQWSGVWDASTVQGVPEWPLYYGAGSACCTCSSSTEFSTAIDCPDHPLDTRPTHYCAAGYGSRGDIDIMFDPFSRVPRLGGTPHAPCDCDRWELHARRHRRETTKAE